MYEQGFRLSQYNTMVALEKQVKCYLAAKTALSLVNPKFQWVVRPIQTESTETITYLPSADSEDDPKTVTVNHEVEVVTIEALGKELKLAFAKLQLARFEPKVLDNVMADPEELATLLAAAGLFKTALEVCELFELSYVNVFDFLIRRCLQFGVHEDSAEWDWLLENDVQGKKIFIFK